MQNPPINPQLLKSAIFGMRRRSMDRDNQAFQQQFQDHTMQQLSGMQNQGIPRAQAMQQLQSQQQFGMDQDEQRRNAFDQEMNDMQARRESFGRASMAPGFRYGYQKPTPQPAAPLRGALSANERSNDRIVQQQIAQNNQGPTAPAKPAPATPAQGMYANSGRAHHTVDQNGAVRYAPSGQSLPGQNVAKSAPAQPQYSQQQVASNRGGQQQPNQNMAGYDQAKANLLKMNPNLGVAGHADNTNFINSLKASYGDNYREHLQQNPQLLAQHYSSMQPQANNPAPSQPAAQQADDGFVGPPPTMDMRQEMYAATLDDEAASSANVGPPAPTPVPASWRIPLPGASQAPNAPINLQPNKTPFTMSGGSPINPAGTSISPGTNSTQPSTPSFGDGANKPMNTPKTARDISFTLDTTDATVEETFRKTASAFGLSEFVTEEALHELGREKTASSREGRFMNHLREELFKMAKDMGDNCPYTPRELTLFSSSAENFQKAAMIEAKTFWLGLSEDLQKRGRDESFLKGILKEAEDFNEALGITTGPSNAGDIISPVVEGAKKVWDSAREHGSEALQGLSQGTSEIANAAQEAGRAAGEAGTSFMGSLKEHGGSAAQGIGQAARTAGSEILDTAKETAGRIKEQAGPAMDKLKENAGKALEKGKSAFKDLTSSLTPEDDRHQIIPGMGNQFLGAAGGALLSALLGGQMGLTGPASWLVPLLGGAAGYHYLPKLMNMWKDAPGTGVNSISPGAQIQNQKNPLVGSPAPFVGPQPPQFTGPDAAMPGASMSPGALSGMAGQTVI